MIMQQDMLPNSIQYNNHTVGNRKTPSKSAKRGNNNAMNMGSMNMMGNMGVMGMMPNMQMMSFNPQMQMQMMNPMAMQMNPYMFIVERTF